MKTNIFVTALLALSAIAAQAQSSLTPPAGAPAPSSHTLNEVYDKAATIEGQSTAQGTKIDSVQTQVNSLASRRPLIAGAPGVTISANGTITISLPGSYYLTNNKLISSAGAHGISVFARDVTIDLNGFALQCGSGTGGSAINLDSVAGARQIRICNGFVRGGSAWSGSTFTGGGWTDGIAGAAADVTISDVTITGVRNDGINCAYATVSNCNVSDVGGTGITAVIVEKCRAMKCALGIKATKSVDRCEGESVHSSTSGIQFPPGIWAPGGIVTHSIGVSIRGVGVNGEFVSHCRGTSDLKDGVYGSVVDCCVGASTSSFGIDAQTITNSTGSTSIGPSGINARLASYCIGAHGGGGVAINAENAIGCIASNGTITAPKKSLGTP